MLYPVEIVVQTCADTFISLYIIDLTGRFVKCYDAITKKIFQSVEFFVSL